MQPPADAVVFVINPNAGRTLPPDTLSAVCEFASGDAGYTAQVVRTRSAQEAASVAAAADAAGAAAIFGIGGDGTLSSLVQGLPPGSATALGVVPMGTANVWADETRLPDRPLAAIAAQLSALRAGEVVEGDAGVMSVDTGVVHSPNGSRRFLLMAGFGMDAAAVALIERRRTLSRMKRALGEPAYFLSALSASVGRRGWRLRLYVDDQPPIDVEAGLLSVGNSRQLGTWLEVNPLASVTDGMLDAALVDAPPWRALALAPLARGGLMRNAPGVRTFRFRRLQIAPYGDPPPVQVDGDMHDAATHTVEVQPSSLRVLAPHPDAPVFRPPPDSR